MKRQLLVILILTVTPACLVHAQQDPLYSQYMFNMLGINPAYAGSRDLLSISALARSQWSKVPGSPETQLLTGDFSIKKKKIGLGMQLFNDQIGISKSSGMYLSYAYRLRLSKGTLAMGLQGGFQFFRANYNDVALSTNQDDAAFQENVREFQPNMGAGLYYSTEKFYVGFSVPNILGTSGLSNSSSAKEIYRSKQYFLATGYVFDLTTDIVLKPSVLVRLVSGAPVSFDFNANIWFYDRLSLGMSARSSGIMVGLLELQINRQTRFGYAYDWNSKLTNQGSHEIMLRYEFGFAKKKMISTRYF